MKYYVFIPFFFFFSCRDLVQDEFADFPQIPVVNSILVADSSLNLHLSLSGRIDTNQLQTIDDADILLFVNNILSEKMSNRGNGLYIAQSKIQSGNKYTCKIKISGYELIVASDSIVLPVQLLRVKHIRNAGKTEEGENYPAVEFTFSNRSNEILYFEVLIKLFVYDEIQNANIIFIEDPLILNEGLPIAVFSNELIKGDEYTMRLNYTTGYNNGKDMMLFPFVLEIRTLSYDYYRFIKQLYLYEQSRYPDGFSGTPTSFSVYSNIGNAYGIFAGYSKTSSDIIIPD